MDLRAGGSGSLNAQERQIRLGDLNKLSAETLKYQQELFRNSISMLEQIKIDEPMGETDFADLILAISQLEDVRDIFAAPTEVEKIEIMNKWR
jgi:hypothetical protein